MVRGDSTIDARIAETAHGWRLDRALADAVPTLSRERLKALIASGKVTDESGAPARDPAKKAVGGQSFTVTVPAPAPAHNEPQAIALDIVFEDEHLVVIDKPAGLVVHPAAGNPDGTLVNALLHHCAGRLSGIGGVARPGIVHRIDKDTSGLMVAAKTDRAHEGLAKQFAVHSIDRRYKAIVAGRPNPPAGTIDAPLARSPANRKSALADMPKLLYVWAAGSPPIEFPEGMGHVLPANQVLTLNMHYHPSGKAGTDASKLGLYYTDKAPEKEYQTAVAIKPSLKIPAIPP